MIHFGKYYAMIFGGSPFCYQALAEPRLEKTIDACASSHQVLDFFPQGECKKWSLHSFLKIMATNEKKAVDFITKLAKFICANGLDRTGFVWKVGVEKKAGDPMQGRVHFTFTKPKPLIYSSEPIIDLTTPYQSQPKDTVFGSYFIKADQKEPQSDCFFYNTHAIHFPSLSGNILIVPRGKYVSIFDFAVTATWKEIRDIWQLVWEAFDTTNTKNNLPYEIVAHGGTYGGQTVPHFHLRLETR